MEFNGSGNLVEMHEIARDGHLLVSLSGILQQSYGRVLDWRAVGGFQVNVQGAAGGQAVEADAGGGGSRQAAASSILSDQIRWRYHPADQNRANDEIRFHMKVAERGRAGFYNLGAVMIHLAGRKRR